jgi:hypothetical protein
VADVGCGNGKYFGVRRDLAVLGSDRSAGENLAGGRGWQFTVKKLPLAASVNIGHPLFNQSNN